MTLKPLLKQEVKPSRFALSNTIIIMCLLEAIGLLAFGYGILQSGSSLP
ncbi:MAG: hypothetical protein ABSB29_02810 [Nitrososphaerales archaeon]|jgi:hypothetical protein